MLLKFHATCSHTFSRSVNKQSADVGCGSNSWLRALRVQGQHGSTGAVCPLHWGICHPSAHHPECHVRPGRVAWRQRVPILWQVDLLLRIVFDCAWLHAAHEDSSNGFMAVQYVIQLHESSDKLFLMFSPAFFAPIVLKGCGMMQVIIQPGIGRRFLRCWRSF
jgi:hypothetical protein